MSPVAPLPPLTCTAFAHLHRIAAGELAEVALAVQAFTLASPDVPVLVFDDATAQTIELDLRGTPDDLRQRLQQADTTPPAAEPPPAPRGPGRPKLGVVAREVTLLPRHWEWLAAQPGGASVTLRRLVEEARRDNASRDQVRRAQEVGYRFMSTIAGHLPGFEEATRALFAAQPARFEALVAAWPEDVRAHLLRLTGPAFAPASPAAAGDAKDAKA